MTKEKLEKLTQMSNKIDHIKKELDALDYIRNSDNFSITTKDGRVMYNAYVSVRIPTSLKKIICNEIESKLKLELNFLERKFEQED